jgi:hypothetical protein
MQGRARKQPQHDYPDTVYLSLVQSRNNKVPKQEQKTLEDDSVHDGRNDLDIRMALDPFLLSGRPLLLYQRESHSVYASLERGALERFPGDNIVTVSINEPYCNENDRCLGISHFSVKPFSKHCRQGSNGGRFAMTKAQEDDIRKWFVLECLRNYSKVRVDCKLRMRTANPPS